MLANPNVALLFLLAVFLNSAAGKAKDDRPCPMEESIHITRFQILPNKTLLDEERNIRFSPDLYFREGNATVRGCVCRVKSCVRKCCPLDHHIKEATKCVEGGSDKFHENIFKEKLPLVRKKEDVFFLTGHQNCNNGKYKLEPNVEPDDNFTLLPTGLLQLFYVSEMAENKPVHFSQYCVEYFGDMNLISAILCFPEESVENSPQNVQYSIYSVGMLLSSVFMLLTLAVYALLPQLRNLHGKCLMCHVGCLLSAYISLSIVQLGSDVIPLWLCTLIPFVIQFTFSSAFFWLNIMCFDICWMFNRVRTISGSSAERERKKLIIYSSYAWGCPLFLLIICILTSTIESLPSFVPRPKFGEQSCWYSPRQEDRLAIILYFFGPISVLMIMNLLFFARTAYRVVTLRKGTGMLNRSDNQSSNEKQRTFVLYLKLFVVMGLTWIMEVVSFLVQGPTYMWYVTDVCNTLQGLAIFLIFVWKPKVRRLLRERMVAKEPQTASTASAKMRKISSNTKVEELTMSQN
ncbi:Hypothetical predicted protein [Cloeon dipterum]|uniref:G-protein coupled receptors family 2 profile 2 domain-containing protein n=1 Tax=Cloeon dipterum TaxID=197152 RepID=A0A8S1CCX5_9INSE|nr:Hypothetical predicted protein [Cloeon dipterum]